MIDTPLLEQRVLESLVRDQTPLNLSDLVARVRGSIQDARAVDVKIAALGLVSSGRVSLNDTWQFSAEQQ